MLIGLARPWHFDRWWLRHRHWEETQEMTMMQMSLSPDKKVRGPMLNLAYHDNSNAGV